MTTMTVEQIKEIVAEAKLAAKVAAKKYYYVQLGGRDQLSCGFAWVNIVEHDGARIKGNTKMGKLLKQAGIDQDYSKAFSIWNPSGLPCQNVDTKEVGAVAAAEVFKKHGFYAYAGSRLD